MSVRLCITDTDQKVLNFVEKFGSITISQAQKMFYNTQKYGYDIARRRMRKLVTNGKLRVSRDLTGNENVYYMEKKLSYHDLLVLDYYAELVNHNAKIVYFKRCQSWMRGKCISDAYACYLINNKIYFNIVEVVQTHGIDCNKYKDLYKSGEPQKFNSMIYEKLGGKPINKFPKLVVIDNVNHYNGIKVSDDIEVTQLDFNLRNFTSVFI